jgi:hypothetical protein
VVGRPGDHRKAMPPIEPGIEPPIRPDRGRNSCRRELDPRRDDKGEEGSAEKEPPPRGHPPTRFQCVKGDDQQVSRDNLGKGPAPEIDQLGRDCDHRPGNQRASGAEQRSRP